MSSKIHNVPIFKLEYSEEDISSFLSSAEDILRRGFLSEGPLCREWEQGFANFQNVPAAIAVTSCTAGLEAILKSIDVRGKSVLIPTNTFFATATAVECAGGIPVLVDSDIKSFALCKEDLSRKINKDIGAVIIVHVGGIIAQNILEIKDLCDSYGVPLVEDAAHAHGSYLNDKIVAGNIGIAGSFSFFPTKVMTTGEGGMVTASPDFIQKVKLIKNFGADPDNEKTCLVEQGSNYRIHELTALLGLLENRRAKKRIARRQVLARRYIKSLAGSGYEPITQSTGQCSFYKLILMTDQVGKATDIADFCRQRNVALTGQVYETPIHRQPRFAASYAEDSFPVTDQISKYHICPPLYPELTEEEVDFVCDVLKARSQPGWQRMWRYNPKNAHEESIENASQKIKEFLSGSCISQLAPIPDPPSQQYITASKMSYLHGKDFETLIAPYIVDKKFCDVGAQHGQLLVLASTWASECVGFDIRDQPANDDYQIPRNWYKGEIFWNTNARDVFPDLLGHDPKTREPRSNLRALHQCDVYYVAMGTAEGGAEVCARIKKINPDCLIFHLGCRPQNRCPMPPPPEGVLELLLHCPKSPKATRYIRIYPPAEKKLNEE